uniref:Spermidine synthase n=1 Tax=Meloidogyne javanica TaxID=6303 RepID=A0A915MTP5_MELJA
MPSFFQLLANSGISPLVPPHSTAFSSQKSNSTEGGCSDNEEEEKHKLVTEGKHKTWTRRKCIWSLFFIQSGGVELLLISHLPMFLLVVQILELWKLKGFVLKIQTKRPPKIVARLLTFWTIRVIYNIFNSDTRLWNIDHFTILNEYVAAMAILPFVVGSLHNDLKLSIYSNKVLIIGLGGGSLDMFWHKRFPWLNITIFEINPNVVKLTEKWFDAVNDDTRHVFVQDGILAFNGKLNIKRVRKAVNNNDSQLYDAIVIDACDPIKNASIKYKNKKQQETEFQQQMPCPSSNLISPTFLGLIKRKLTLKGVAIFNLLPLENEEENVKRFVQRRLAAHFPTCIRYKMAKQSNNILACLPYSITQRRKSSKEPTELTNEMFNFWKIRLATLIREFGFKELLNDSTLMNF